MDFSKLVGLTAATCGLSMAVAVTPVTLRAATQPPPANHNDARHFGQAFTFLQSGFTQSLYGTYGAQLFGQAFAPDGSVWSSFNGGFVKFEAGSTYTQNGTVLHTPSAVGDGAVGPGLTEGPGGFLYSNNTADGVAVFDATTGAFIKTIGPAPGDGFGIAMDPRTGNVVYAGAGSTIYSVNPSTGVERTFGVAASSLVDGISFDASGNYLFLSDYSGSTLIIMNRKGATVQDVPMSSTPDGIAFHASAPRFVVTNDTDGTMTRFDFKGDNYASAPKKSVFASGGFYGDHTGVGADGCLYASQEGTRYDDGTTDGNGSVVRICGGFAPGPGALPLMLVTHVVQRGDDFVFHLLWRHNGASSVTSVHITSRVPNTTELDGAAGVPCGSAYTSSSKAVTLCISSGKTTVRPNTSGTIKLVEDVRKRLRVGDKVTTCPTIQWRQAKLGSQHAVGCATITVH